MHLVLGGLLGGPPRTEPGRNLAPKPSCGSWRKHGGGGGESPRQAGRRGRRGGSLSMQVDPRRTR